MLVETIKTFFLQLKDIFLNYEWISDTLDILLVAAIVYAVVHQLRKSQSIQVIKGLILVGLIYGAVSLIGMKTSAYLFSRLFNDIIIIFVILFSTEIRHALENMGKRKLGSRFSLFSSDSQADDSDAINAVCRACGSMSRSKVGSLIVFQRNSLLGDLTSQAVPIDSETTYEMVCSIFYPKAPLHDGAIVIKDGRIVAARCVVPMKNDRDIGENVGTRHRAALEISMSSDAVAVVTSEETGIISLAVDGTLTRGLTDSELRERLGRLLLNDGDDKEKKRCAKKNKQAVNDKVSVTDADEDKTESVEQNDAEGDLQDEQE